MVEICNAQGQVIHRSKNLRGILDHARRTWVQQAVAAPAPDGKGILHVTFGDGSTCQTAFADFTVLCWWLGSRRSWAGSRRIGTTDLF